MRKYVWAAFILLIGTANAARLDVSRLTVNSEFSATFGLAFVSGLNSHRTAQTDLAAGRVRTSDLDLEYTFLNDWTAIFSTDDKYSDVKFGLRRKILKTVPIKFDLFADYGAAWTRDSDTHDRLGQNNLDFGFHLHGIQWRHFQWGLKVFGQFVFADSGNFWNLNTTSALMYYFTDATALKLAWDHELIQIHRPHTIYNSALGLGLVYNMSGRMAINPYIKYHFPKHGGTMVGRDNDNYWKIGTQFSVVF